MAPGWPSHWQPALNVKNKQEVWAQEARLCGPARTVVSQPSAPQERPQGHPRPQLCPPSPGHTGVGSVPPADAHSSPGPKGWRSLPQHPHLSPSHEKHTQPQGGLREGKKRQGKVAAPERRERERDRRPPGRRGRGAPAAPGTHYLRGIEELHIGVKHPADKTCIRADAGHTRRLLRPQELAPRAEGAVLLLQRASTARVGTQPQGAHPPSYLLFSCLLPVLPLLPLPPPPLLQSLSPSQTPGSIPTHPEEVTRCPVIN